MEGICCMTPLPSGFYKNRPPKFTPPPSGISKIFTHPLEILLSLIAVNKEVVLFTRMPNFVSFMYFLLNCITDRQILMPTPYALKSQTNFVSFMYFLLNSTTDKQTLFALKSRRNNVEKVLGHTQMKCKVAWEINITVLFSHYVKKKATLEEV